MQIVEVAPGDAPSASLFHEVAKVVYAGDPVWSSASEMEFDNHWAQASTRKEELFRPFIVLDVGRPVARAVAILKPEAVAENGQPQAYIGFFECMENQPEVACLILGHCEQVLTEAGAHTILAPKVDNQLFGCQTGKFDLPHMCLTPHSPPFYLSYFQAAGYGIKEHIKTLFFRRETAGGEIKFTLPGFRTREFDRSKLASEIEVFHRLQAQVFESRPGYVPRSLDEDSAMINALLKFIDDELIIIAETDQGDPVGILVCLPDYYQALVGEPIDRARIITIGLLPEVLQQGIGTLMGVHLMRNLLRKTQYTYVEASLVLAQNIAPQALANRFPSSAGRSFAVLEKTVSED